MSASWIKSSTRYAIYHRDGFACVYCGATKADGVQLTLDHVKPRSRDGTHVVTNLVTCCTACNTARADRGIRAWVTLLMEFGVPEDVASAIPARVRTQTAKPIDRAEGRRLAKALRVPSWGFAKYVR